MLEGANIEGEDEQEETIQDMEGLFCCCKHCAILQNRLRFHVRLASDIPRYELEGKGGYKLRPEAAPRSDIILY